MPRYTSLAQTDTVTNAITTVTTSVIDVRRAKTVGVQSVVTVNTPAAKTAVAGVVETAIITFLSKAATTAKDYVAIYDTTGAAWAVYADTTGSTTAPSGAIYTATASAKKVKANISSDTSAADVAARFVTAFNSLTGFTAKVTLTDNTDGTVTYALATRVSATDAVTKTGTDSGAGTMTIGTITQGVTSKVDTTADTITITAHGYTTGLKLQASSTSTLPAGLSTSTDYYVVSVDANTISLASSLALSLVPTVIDITGQGTSGSTITLTPTAIAGATITLQKSNDYNPSTASGTFDAVAAATSIAATGDIWISDIDPSYQYIRLSYTLTAGRLSAVSTTVIKEDL